MPDPEQIADAAHKAAEEVTKIAEAYKKADEEVTKASDRVAQVADAVAKMRLEFFDRVVLLDGGTITLSVTLLGFLASKNALVHLRWPKLLILSWISFVFSMLFALARNWLEHERLSATESYNEAFQTLSTIIEFSQTVPVNKLVEDNSARLKRTVKEKKSLRRWTSFTGIASLIAMLMGFVLLLMFAGKNVFTIGG